MGTIMQGVKFKKKKYAFSGNFATADFYPNFKKY